VSMPTGQTDRQMDGRTLGRYIRLTANRSQRKNTWDNLQASAVHFVDSSEPNEEAVRLMRELKLHESIRMIRMLVDGDLDAPSRRVFGITSIDVCGF